MAQNLWMCDFCKKEFETKKYKFKIFADISKLIIELNHLKKEHGIKPHFLRYIRLSIVERIRR